MNTKLSELVAQYQKANEGKEVSIAVIKKKELLDTLSPLVGKENARKIYDLRRAILLSELEDTVKEFPVLHKKQVIRLFEKCACVRKEDSIDGGRMMRPTLISLVEKLEAYTGRKITQDNDAPLRYLEDACDPGETITIEDIADYFSERKERKISKLIARSCQPFTEMWKKKQRQNSRNVIKKYLADSCGVKPEQLNETEKVLVLHPADIPYGNDDYFVVIFWLEDRFKKILPKSFDCNTRTVGELIDFFAAN